MVGRGSALKLRGQTLTQLCEGGTPCFLHLNKGHGPWQSSGYWDFVKGKLETLSAEHQSVLEKIKHIGNLRSGCLLLLFCVASRANHNLFVPCVQTPHFRLQLDMTSLGAGVPRRHVGYRVIAFAC